MASNEQIIELVERVFCSRNYAHFSHWKTRSYAEHMALGDFYADVIDKVDAFVEAYQAAFGLVNFQKEEKEKEEEAFDEEITKHLQDDVKWISKNRAAISRDVEALGNLLDELVDSYLSTIYKLRFLS